MIIDLYTDWCGWCKVMDRNTFTDSDVISHINNNFVAIKLREFDKLTTCPVTFTSVKFIVFIADSFFLTALEIDSSLSSA